MKRIVVCCDGTWDKDDLQTEDTNLAQIARSIHGSVDTGGASLQIVLYLRGVGTTGLKLETLIEGATGLGIDEGIRSGYQFIAQNYVPDDEIFLFGFSRGAFTARSLIGLISACGVLERQSLAWLPDTWKYYRSPRSQSPQEFANRYRAQAHDGVTIKFVGVWDTVGSLGIPGALLADATKKAFAFHDTSPCSIVETAVQALAIDEHRHNFIPTYWTGTAPAGSSVQLVWFAGAHADVGGGYKTRPLADIPPVWMGRKAEAAGLAIDWDCSPKGKPSAGAPAHDSSSGLFALDHFRPTLRRFGERSCETAFNESLYVAQDENGRPVQAINEAVHRSVIDRYGKPAEICMNDERGACSIAVDQPETLRPCFGPSGFSGLPIVD